MTKVATEDKITYFISYGTISLTESAINAEITVPLPSGTNLAGFSGTTDVADAAVVGTDLIIDMIDPLPAGSSGIMTLELVVEAGSFCDGDMITTTAVFTADNADNTATASTDVTVEALNPDWEVDVSTGVVGVPGSNSVFDVTVGPASSTGYISLENGTVTLDKPANTTVVSCDGCAVSGNTLSWSVSDLNAPTSFSVVLNFPSPAFDFGDPFTLDGSLNGTTDANCPFPVSDTDTESGMLPAPDPEVECAANLSELEIGASGSYTANATVPGNTEVDDLTLTIDIPAQINVTAINAAEYLYSGINATLSYTTNLNPSPQLLGNFVTSSSAGAFSLPSLGAGEYLTSLVYEYGTVPPGFEILGGGISLGYDVLSVDQDGNTVVGANPRVTLSPEADCPGNTTYTCVSPSVSVTADYQGTALSSNCSNSELARTPPEGPGNPSKSGGSETGTSVFPGQEVSYTISFQQCGQNPLTNGMVTDVLPAGMDFVPGSVTYSPNFPMTPAFSQSGQTLTWDLSAFNLSGAMPGEECSAPYLISYKATVSAVASGSSSIPLTNTFSVTGDDVDIPGAPPVEDSQTVNVLPLGPNNPDKSYSGASTVNPGETITYFLNFDIQGNADASNVIMIDVLPLGLDFVPGTISYNGGMPAADNAGMEYDAVNRTLSFNWATLPGAPDGNTNISYSVSYDVMVPQGFQPGPIQNCFTVDGSGPDFRTDPPREDCSTITINPVVQITSRKGVQGDCDPDFVFFNSGQPQADPANGNFNGVAQTFEGGSADFKMIIENTGNVAVKDLVAIDILPFIGDQAVSAPFDRLSEWRPNFTGITSIDPGIDVFYTVEQNPCRTEFSPAVNPSGCTGPLWSTTPPVNLADVQALKFELANPIAPGESVEIVWSMLAPPNIATELIAWNSFAYQGRRTDTPGMEYFFTVEPNKVGIYTKPRGVAVGNYVWMDENENGIQDEGPESGVNGVEVTLYSVGPDGIKDGPGTGDDMLVGTKITGDDGNGDPGYYLFPDLDPGSYYVVFNSATFPSGLTAPGDMPTILNAGTDDTVDSDADMSTMFMTDATPVLDGGMVTEDLTLDLGLTPTKCNLIPNITVVCDNRNTTTTNDDRYYWYVSVDRVVDGTTLNASANGSDPATFYMFVKNASGDLIDVVTDVPYGTQVPGAPGYGPFPISNGDLSIMLQDNFDITCTTTAAVEAPATIEIASATATDCIYNGTAIEYDLSGTVNIGGTPPPGSRLEVFFTENGVVQSQVFDPIATDGSYSYSFTGLGCSGEQYNIRARFIDAMGNRVDNTCEGIRNFRESGLDFGDLPEGTGYPTTAANIGAVHMVPQNPVIKLGASVDTENDGQPSALADGDGGDENGFDPADVLFVRGGTVDVTLPVMNMTGATAKLTLFADWDNDGTFSGTNEMYSVNVPNNATSVTIPNVSPPGSSPINTPVGLRFRISTDMAAVMSETGVAPDGEVEDYLVEVVALDYGDLADNGAGTDEQDYETLSGSNGAVHILSTNPAGDIDLKIGASVDEELDGQPSADADGDGADEDGFDPNSVMFVRTQAEDIDIPVMNTTGSEAKLTLYVDWDNDGNFDEPNEMFSVNVPDNTNGDVTLSGVTPPADAALNTDLGFRLRLTTDM
ncbi:MAG: DUF11 domain-containing protein, partial [Bacteroidetes bacterium]|nr:DUF11 domain-containing protein [Bacteroidota bacterium]